MINLPPSPCLKVSVALFSSIWNSVITSCACRSLLLKHLFSYVRALATLLQHSCMDITTGKTDMPTSQSHWICLVLRVVCVRALATLLQHSCMDIPTGKKDMPTSQSHWICLVLRIVYDVSGCDRHAVVSTRSSHPYPHEATRRMDCSSGVLEGSSKSCCRATQKAYKAAVERGSGLFEECRTQRSSMSSAVVAVVSLVAVTVAVCE